MNENGKANERLSPSEWKKVEADFLNYSGTIGEFCEQYKNKELFFSTVYKHSCVGNWIKKREAVKLLELQSGKIPFDEKVSSSLTRAMKIIGTALDEKDVSAKDVSGLVTTIERIQAVEYRMMDIPLPKQRIETLTDPKSPAEEHEEQVKRELQKIQDRVESGDNGKGN